MVVLGTAIGMRALRPNAMPHPRIACRFRKWVSKVNRRRYNRVLEGAARNYGQDLMIASWQAMRHGRRGGCIFSPPPSGLAEMGTATICCR